MSVRFEPREALDRSSNGAAHQGVVAVTSAKQYNDLEDVIAAHVAAIDSLSHAETEQSRFQGYFVTNPLPYSIEDAHLIGEAMLSTH